MTSEKNRLVSAAHIALTKLSTWKVTDPELGSGRVLVAGCLGQDEVLWMLDHTHLSFRKAETVRQLLPFRSHHIMILLESVL